MEHLPFELMETEPPKAEAEPAQKTKIDDVAATLIAALAKEGLGARKIASRLKENGYDIAYYQVAYYLKKMVDA